MIDVNSLVSTVFSGLAVLVVEDVVDGGDAVVVTARTRDAAVPCPVCRTLTVKVHGYHCRAVADVPVDGRQVVRAGARLVALVDERAPQGPGAVHPPPVITTDRKDQP